MIRNGIHRLTADAMGRFCALVRSITTRRFANVSDVTGNIRRGFLFNQVWSSRRPSVIWLIRLVDISEYPHNSGADR